MRKTKDEGGALAGRVAGEEELLRALDSKQVDGVILQEDIANSALARFAGKYRIPARLGTAPGYIFMAHPTVPASTREAARSVFLNLRAGDASAERILRGIDGQASAVGFDVANDDEMAILIRMFNQSASYDRKTPAAPAATPPPPTAAAAPAAPGAPAAPASQAK